MRHGDKINNLGRKVGHRRSMMKNMANSLLKHKRIFTTLAKAKAMRRFIEPLITKSKNNTTHSRRVVFSYLQSKESIKELFDIIAPKVGDRPGGYVRVIRAGFRKGDAAEMAMIELVDFNEVMIESKSEGIGGGAKRKKTRRGGGGVKKTESPAAAKTVEAPAAEAEETNEEE